MGGRKFGKSVYSMIAWAGLLGAFSQFPSGGLVMRRGAVPAVQEAQSSEAVVETPRQPVGFQSDRAGGVARAVEPPRRPRAEWSRVRVAQAEVEHFMISSHDTERVSLQTPRRWNFGGDGG